MLVARDWSVYATLGDSPPLICSDLYVGAFVGNRAYRSKQVVERHLILLQNECYDRFSIEYQMSTNLTPADHINGHRDTSDLISIGRRRLRKVRHPAVDARQGSLIVETDRHPVERGQVYRMTNPLDHGEKCGAEL